MARATSKSPRTSEQGLAIERRFTSAGVHPYDELEWEKRDAVIGDPDDPVFEQRGVEFPTSWSQNATNIVAQKYFRGQPGSPERESSVRQMVDRVAGRIAEAGRESGYFASDDDADAFEAELTHILVNQKAAFNSPVWFNVGWRQPGQEQASACFILSVEDEMESILDWNTQEGIIFKGGSGSGINLSKIRGSMEPLSKGGTASGPVSFMRGADSWAGAIKSGGGTRRAAKMVVLDVDHPDIEDFIWLQGARGGEGRGAEAGRLRHAAWTPTPSPRSSSRTPTTRSGSPTSSCRRSRTTRTGTWSRARDGSTIKTGQGPRADAADRRRRLALRRSGRPVRHHINRWHTSPDSGRITASNPCSANTCTSTTPPATSPRST